MGSDPEQEDVEKGSQSCPKPRVSLQLPKGERETWSSGGGGVVIKVEIEPLRPNLSVSPGLEEAVSVRGQAGVHKSAHAGGSCRLDPFDAALSTRRSAGTSVSPGFLCSGTNGPFLQNKGPGSRFITACFSYVSSWDLPCCSPCLLPLVLSLCTSKKSLAPSFL